MFGDYYYTRDMASPQVSPYQQYMQMPQQVPQQTPQQAGQQIPQGAVQQMLQMPYVPQVNSAYAMIAAGPDYPSIKGYVTFTDVSEGVRICAEITGLPAYKPATGDKSPVGPFGFHIHDNGNCSVGNPTKPFEASGGHWNPANQPHGNHAGDFPVLVASDGRAIMCFVLNRFRVADILGKSVVIHENPDDYRTQPAGNSGKRIACGVIMPWNPYQQYVQ